MNRPGTPHTLGRFALLYCGWLLLGHIASRPLTLILAAVLPEAAWQVVLSGLPYAVYVGIGVILGGKMWGERDASPKFAAVAGAAGMALYVGLAAVLSFLRDPLFFTYAPLYYLVGTVVSLAVGAGAYALGASRACRREQRERSVPQIGDEHE